MDRFSILIYIFAFFLRQINFSNSKMFHQIMTVDEREYIFGTSDEKVPEYELVQVLHSTDDQNITVQIEFQAFNRSISLKLNDINEKLLSLKTPIWLAEGKPDFSEIKLNHVYHKSLHDALKFYEDPKNMAGVGIERDANGNYRFTGYMKDGIVLEKIPERLYQEWDRIFGKAHFSRTSSAKYHIVFKQPSKKSAPTNDLELSYQELKKKNPLRPYNGTDPIYPRILLLVNFPFRFASDRELNFYKLLIYLISFWNSVNLKYADFENPKIRLHIVGIIIGNNKWAAPWLRQRFETRLGMVESMFASRVLSNFLKTNDPLNQQWDIAISQSDTLLYLHTTSKPIKGLAFIGSTCNFNNMPPYIYSMAFIADEFMFSGVHAATHEIGHLFGANHNSKNSTLCNKEGFIMSPTTKFCESCLKGWSWCSKHEILLRLRNRMDKCWKNTPIISPQDKVPVLLPGYLSSLEEQCILRGYDYLCKNETTCDSLYCWAEGFLGINWFPNL